MHSGSVHAVLRLCEVIKIRGKLYMNHVAGAVVQCLVMSKGLNLPNIMLNLVSQIRFVTLRIQHDLSPQSATSHKHCAFAS